MHAEMARIPTPDRSRIPRWPLVLCLAALVGLPAPGLPAPTQKPVSHPQATSSKKTSPAKKRRVRRARGQSAPTPERIREIQAALAQAGCYSGEPTGKWDAASAEAMKRFQQAQGLQPTGKIDALSLQKLGLGSEVAGLAPPRPAVNSAPQR